MSNLPQPPEGILDPKIPWSYIRPESRLWVILKARLTGRPTDGEHYSSYVNISEADADRLIANLKKDPRGYPSLDQESGTPVQWMDRQEKYQKWLVADYLENPFRKEVNQKIEDAEIERRLQEIQEERKSRNKPKSQEEDKEQQEVDQEQQELEDKIDDLTEDIDTELEEPNEPVQQPRDEQKDSEDESNPEDSGISDIKDSLEQIKGSLKIQVADLETTNKNDSLSVASLESLKQLFQTQNDIFRQKLETTERKQEEASLEQTQDVSGTAEATDLTADNKAEGIIQGVDGNVITVKTTDGEFKQGEKITQGGGNNFFDMLKGIAGKFFNKGGAGASPTKMSSGGFVSAGIPTPLSEGTIAPGVYDKPTRGTLGMNQMVIPLNRNVGKPFRQNKKDSRLRKFDQPMIDVMSQPLKAIGLSILSVAGNFLKSLGPLAGFFLPYAKGLVKGFAAILGVPGTLIMGLLGGPAYAAMDQQDKQQNVFVKLWKDLMEAFGFDLGEDGKKDKKKKDKVKGNATGGMIPGDAPPEVKAMLEAISAGEGSWDSVNPGTTVEGLSGMTIADARRAAMQKGYSMGGSGAMGKWQQMPEFIIGRAKSAGLNPDKDIFDAENQTKIARMLMAGVYPGGERQLVSDVQRDPLIAASNLTGTWPSLPGGSQQNTSREKFLANFNKSMEKYSAAKGVQVKDNSSGVGKVMGWQIIDGPDSGYKVNDNLTMHGQEAYLQHENGFSILPIENNEYSLTKNPEKTMNRWKEILGTKSADSKTSFASGGSRASQQRSRLGVQKVNGRYVNMGVSDAAVGKNPWWRVWNKKGATAERRKKQEALAKSLAERLNREEGLNKPRPAAPSSTPRQRPSFSSIASKPKSAAEKPKEKTETDLMMEQYNQLIAAGKHTEAKELGMNIWNKTWKKTDKGLERIPSTPLSATSAKPNQPAPTQPITPTLMNSPSVVSIPAPQPPVIIPVMSDPRIDFATQVERTFC